MKVIDVLQKIADGEEVRFKILDNDEIRDEIFEVENGHLRNSTCGKWLEIELSPDTWESISSYFLNEEVEIIEEEKKIPEKIGVINYVEDQATVLIHNKVDEIIDYLKSKGE